MGRAILEEKLLVLWEPFRTDRSRALVESRRLIRLDSADVAADDEVRGSTHRVTKTWVHQTLRDCEAHGERIEIDASIRAHRS